MIRTRLQNTVQFNNLAPFYPPQRLEQVVQRVSQVILQPREPFMHATCCTQAATAPSPVKLWLPAMLQVDFDGLTQRWRFQSVELALDLVSLALYDVVLLLDDR
jgi:hypothetical protein